MSGRVCVTICVCVEVKEQLSRICSLLPPLCWCRDGSGEFYSTGPPHLLKGKGVRVFFCCCCFLLEGNNVYLFCSFVKTKLKVGLEARVCNPSWRKPRQESCYQFEFSLGYNETLSKISNKTKLYKQYIAHCILCQVFLVHSVEMS